MRGHNPFHTGCVGPQRGRVSGDDLPLRTGRDREKLGCLRGVRWGRIEPSQPRFAACEESTRLKRKRRRKLRKDVNGFRRELFIGILKIGKLCFHRCHQCQRRMRARRFGQIDISPHRDTMTKRRFAAADLSCCRCLSVQCLPIPFAKKANRRSPPLIPIYYSSTSNGVFRVDDATRVGPRWANHP